MQFVQEEVCKGLLEPGKDTIEEMETLFGAMSASDSSVSRLRGARERQKGRGCSL
jgi:hypothetical protein